MKIVVPYPPGTEPDVLARDIGIALNQQTGKPFVIENRPGANAMIGADAVAKADGDGGTLLMIDRLAVVTNPLLYSKVSYDWEKTLKPITDVARVQLFVGVREGLPVKSFADFVAYAKANPRKIMVGTGGNGHVNHIGMAMLAQAHGLEFTYVPYRGVAPAVQGLLTGEVDVVMAGGLAMQGHAKSGKVRLLVVGGEKRAEFMPDVPTLAEAGGKPGSIPSTEFALIAPSKVPDAMINEIQRSVDQVVNQPALKSRYTSRGLVVSTTSPAETRSMMNSDATRYERIIRDAKIKVE